MYQSATDEAAAAHTHEGEACLVCAGIDLALDRLVHAFTTLDRQYGTSE